MLIKMRIMRTICFAPFLILLPWSLKGHIEDIPHDGPRFRSRWKGKPRAESSCMDDIAYDKRKQEDDEYTHLERCVLAG